MIRKRKHRKTKHHFGTTPDSAVIDLMTRYHSDLTKSRRIYFYLYFPNERNAFVAKCELAANGFSVEMDRSASDSQWLCLASKEMIADDRELTKLRRYFTKLAESLHGNYDGWETEM